MTETDTTAVSTISRPLAIVIQKEIDAAVAAVLANHGLKKSPSRCSYSATNVSYKVEANVVVEGTNGVNLTSKEAQTFLLYAKSLGVENGEAALGATVTMRGIQYVFLGMNAKAYKLPLLFRRVSDGRNYKFPDTVASRLPGYDAEKAKAGLFG